MIDHVKLVDTPLPTIEAALDAFPGGDQLEPMLARARVVSFDFFDTLFSRPFNDPEMVFDLLGRRLGIADFRARRIAAQSEAFRRMATQGRHEIRLQDIYECMNLPAAERIRLADAEMTLEHELLVPQPGPWTLFCALLHAGRRVVVCSDMYLPRIFFDALLKRHGVEACEVWVSSEVDATKRDHGELFLKMAEGCEVVIHDFLHIGDDPLGDVTRALEKGVMAFHFRNDARPSSAGSRRRGLFRFDGLLKRQIEKADTEDDREAFLRHIGYDFGGPANLGFLRWVAQEARADDIEHLLFLSRDGYLLEQIARSEPNGTLPPSHYFMGSRVAFALASVTDGNFAQNLPFLLSGSDGLQPRELFDRINVRAPAEQVMRDIGCPPDLKVRGALHPMLSKLLYAWRGEILQVCRRNRRALRMYLDAIGVKPGARVGLVDVGWSGSTQETFETATAALLDLEVFGYYFMLGDTPERRQRESRQRMRSMVDERLLGADERRHVYLRRAVIELFFSAPHSTVIGWNIDIASHDVQPVMDDGRGGDAAGLAQLNNIIIAGAREFCTDYSNFTQRIGADFAPSDLVRPLLELVLHDEATCHRIADEVVNFDTWSSTQNQATNLMDYEKHTLDADRTAPRI